MHVHRLGMTFWREPGIMLVGAGQKDFRFCLIKRGPDDMSSVRLHWTGPLKRRRYSFVFAWPRRDNKWARWRYDVFEKTGEYVNGYVSPQVVMW